MEAIIIIRAWRRPVVTTHLVASNHTRWLNDCKYDSLPLSNIN